MTDVVIGSRLDPWGRLLHDRGDDGVPVGLIDAAAGTPHGADMEMSVGS